jgi:NADP-dependent 3-hydroxy acid dehydrogenase YdfG
VGDVSKQSGVEDTFKLIGKLLLGVKLDSLVTNAGSFSGIYPLGTQPVSQ